MGTMTSEISKYVSVARAWARMGWNAEGILCHKGNPLFMILGLRDTDFVQPADFDAPMDYHVNGAKRYGEYSPFTTRYNDVGVSVIEDMIRDVRPYSIEERQRREDLRVQRCEDAEALRNER